MSFLSISNRVNGTNRRVGPLVKTLIALTGLISSVLVSAQPSLAVGEVVVGVGGDPVSAVRTGCTTGAVNALLNVGNVLYAAGRTNSGCTSGSAASQKGWVGKFSGGVWTAIGSQTGFDSEVNSLVADGNILYAGGQFTNKIAKIDYSTATSSTSWSNLPGNNFASTTYLSWTSQARVKVMKVAGSDLLVGGSNMVYPLVSINSSTGAITPIAPNTWSSVSNHEGITNDIELVGSRLFIAYDMGANNASTSFVGSGVAFTDDNGATWTKLSSITVSTRQLETDGTDIFAATATGLAQFTAASATGSTTPTSLKSWTGYPYEALAYASGSLCVGAGENSAAFAPSPYSSWTAHSGSSIVPYSMAIIGGKCYWAGSGTKDQTYTTASSWVAKWDMPPPSLSPTTQTRVTKINAAMSQTNTITPSAFSATPTYSISPGLPTGLSMSSSTGVISGTPTVAQTATTYVITGTAGSESATATVTITVNSITPATQTISGTPGSAITASTAFTPTAFTGAVSYAVTTGALPTGLSMSSSTGVITGTPTAASSATITITATGATSGSATATVTFAITSLTPATQTISGTPGSAITASTAFTPTAFTGAVSYAVTTGALPTGLSMSSSTGVITGTPTAASSATITITATGATSGSATATVTFAITSLTPPLQTISGTTGSAITASTAFTPTAFTGAVSYAVTTGALPTGLSMSSSTGVITGTPTAASSATITITATGATSGSATATVTFAITNAVVLTVTASSHTLTAGDAVPTITGSPSVSGIARTGETCTTTYTTSSAAGTYPTTCSGGTAAGYAITYLAGTITVSAAATTTTTTVPVVTVAPTAVSTPELVTSANQQQFEAAPGEANAVINGKAVNVVVVKPEATSDPAALLASANKIVDDLEKLVPQGAASPVKVVKTAEGASLTGILTSPDDPKQSIPVPVESVTLVKAGNTAMLVSALNQTDVPALLNAGGTIEVTRGGSLAAIAYGLPSAEKGEIILMSTPRLLGNFTVDANGSYKGQVPLPKNIEFGSHTVVMATKNAKVSLGIKLVRTRLEYRIKKKTSPNLFLRRAGIAKSNVAPVKVSGQGRCQANSKQIIFSAKPGRCFITVKQAAVGSKKAIFYRFTVKVVTKPTKRTLKQ